jgi:hypothetical protein
VNARLPAPAASERVTAADKLHPHDSILAHPLPAHGSWPVSTVEISRKRLGRVRRYWQISRILVRPGLLPYLRGERRSEFRSPDGRAVHRGECAAVISEPGLFDR